MNSYKCCKPNTKEKENILAQLELLRLISDENRLRILCVLQNGEHCVSELVGHAGVSQSLVSHHLADLRQEWIVLRERRGRRMYYSLTEKGSAVMLLLTRLSKKEGRL